MKRINYVFIFIIYMILLASCSDNTEEVVDLVITSNTENQISRVDQFEISSIWIDVTYASGKKEQVTLDKSMLSKADYAKTKQAGEHTITIQIGNQKKDIFLFLYDESILNQKHIYCFGNEKLNFSIADSAYEVDSPIPDNFYFYNWYLDEECTQPYNSLKEENEVIHLYAKYSSSKTYSVRFYHKDILIYEEYVHAGESATPPVMTSFEDYIFIGWDRSFSNIQQDTEIHSVYSFPSSKIRYFDYYGNIILETTASLDNSLMELTPDRIEGMVFVGWNKNLNIDENCVDIYPLYQSKVYEIRFYQDSLEKYLYSDWVGYEESTSCTYEITNYYISGYSEFLDSITSNIDVIVYYSPIEYSYYIGDELVCVLPFYDKPPAIENIEGQNARWVRKDDTTFELITTSYYGYDIELVTTEYGSIYVPMEDFIYLNPTCYIGIEKKSYCFYEWYYDEYYLSLVNDFYNIEENTKLYGKRVEYDTDVTGLSFQEVVIDGKRGYDCHFNDSKNTSLVIPKYYNALPVLSVTIGSAGLSNMEYLFLSNVITKINILDGNYPKGIFVETGNYIYYDIDGSLYQYGIFRDTLVAYCTGDSIVSELRINNEYDILESALNNLVIDKLYIEEGIQKFENDIFKNCQVNEVYLPNSLLELNANSLGNQLKSIHFLNGCSLMKMNLSILDNFVGTFEIPNSVKFLDFSNKDLYKSRISIGDNHPYFKIKGDFILDKNEEILIKAFNSMAHTIEIPFNIKYLFNGCFNGMYIHNIIFHKDLKESIGYHGYTSRMTEYDIFYNTTLYNLKTPLELCMTCPASLSQKNKNRFMNSITMFGSMLVSINHIQGDYTIPSYVTHILPYAIGENVNIDTLYIPKGITIDPNAFVLDSTSKLRRVVILE